MDWHHAQLSDVQQHTHKVTFCSIFSTLPDKIQIWTRVIGCRSAFWKKQQLGIPGLLCGVPVNVRMFNILMLYVYSKYTIPAKRHKTQIFEEVLKKP